MASPGAATRRAVLAFQKDHMLAQDGLITPAVCSISSRHLQAGQQRSTPITLSAGDRLSIATVRSKLVAAERVVQWDQAFGKNVLVAARPATAGWPPARAPVWTGRSPMRWTRAAMRRRNGRARAWNSVTEIRTFAL